jgi:hypothetical protein
MNPGHGCKYSHVIRTGPEDQVHLPVGGVAMNLTPHDGHVDPEDHRRTRLLAASALLAHLAHGRVQPGEEPDVVRGVSRLLDDLAATDRPDRTGGRERPAEHRSSRARRRRRR